MQKDNIIEKEMEVKIMQGLFADRFLKHFFRNRMHLPEANTADGAGTSPENGTKPSPEPDCALMQELASKEITMEEGTRPILQSVDLTNSEEIQSSGTHPIKENQ